MGAASAGVALAAVVFGVTSLQPAGTSLEIGPSSLSASEGPPSAGPPSEKPSSQVPPSPGTAQENPLANAELEIIIPAGRGVCRFTNGMGQVEINATYDAKVFSSAIFGDRPIGAALIEIRAGQGTPLRQIHIYRMADTSRDAVLLDKQLGEFRDATKVEAIGRDLHVTIKGEVKVYPIP